MRSRLFRTMGASLSLAASIALSAGSTQALVGPGRGGSTTQSNLAQSQARWPLGGDPSDLTSDTQQDTTGQLDVRERNENGPFTLGSRVNGGDVAQANVALGSADDEATGKQSDETGDATLDQTTGQTLIGQDPRPLRNESDPVVLWSEVDSGDVAQANVQRGSVSNASATRQEAEQPPLSAPLALAMSEAAGDPPIPGGIVAGRASLGTRSNTDQTVQEVVNSLGSAPDSSGAPGVADASGLPGLEGPLARAHDAAARIQSDSVQPGTVGSNTQPEAVGPNLGPASLADPATSSTTQSATGQMGTVQVNVNDPVTVLSRVRSGDVQQANVAIGHASNQSRTHQSDPNDPVQTAVGQDTTTQVNVNAPVAVLSRVEGGDVRQANISTGEASNGSTTSQESSGGDLISNGADELPSGSLSSTTDQSATGQTGVAQVNVNAPVTVLSRVKTGDVAQANVALGQASNHSLTSQESSAPPTT
ncbi:MAG TPA: hypothetical protein VFD49_05290 [Candidatus Dormibacteraeota bacterium]|nr:hypothetical protein [Candidatus Dormibacteraeota bacterium]